MDINGHQWTSIWHDETIWNLWILEDQHFRSFEQGYIIRYHIDACHRKTWLWHWVKRWNMSPKSWVVASFPRTCWTFPCSPDSRSCNPSWKGWVSHFHGFAMVLMFLVYSITVCADDKKRVPKILGELGRDWATSKSFHAPGRLTPLISTEAAICSAMPSGKAERAPWL